MCKLKGHKQEIWYRVVSYPLYYKFKKKAGVGGRRIVNAVKFADPFEVVARGSSQGHGYNSSFNHSITSHHTFTSD